MFLRRKMNFRLPADVNDVLCGGFFVTKSTKYKPLYLQKRIHMSFDVDKKP